jgi:hypothetical protein
MNRRTTILLGSFAVAVSAGVLEAQTQSRPRSGTVTRTPATESGRTEKSVRAGIIQPAPAAEPVVVNTTGLPMGNTSGLAGPVVTSPGYIVPVQVAQVSYYPTVVLTDGRVLANFGTGRGYEQVLRRCPNFTGAVPYGVAVSPCWVVDAYGRYSVIQQR